MDDKSLWQSIVAYFKNIIHKDILIEETVNDVIGNNAKVVIFTLFGLLLASIIMYSVLLTGKYNPDSMWSGTAIPFDIKNSSSKEFIRTLENEAYMNILISKDNATVKLNKINEFNEDRITNFQERFQQIEQIDAVFIAAITGAVALGGTLITQLWARRQGQ